MVLRSIIADWVADVQPGSGPRYMAIANAIGAAIDRGALAPGDRLPPHRALASALGVDLTTVTRAYAEARRRGLLDAAVGSGTFIRKQPGDEAPQISVDMSMNIPPAPANVQLRDLLRDGISKVLRGSDVATLMAYRAGAGSREDRAAGAAWVAPTCGVLPASRVLLSSGTQSALLAICGSLLKRGDVVATEAMTYPGFRALAFHTGLHIAGVACDAEGMLPDALDEVCRRQSPRAIYCTPTIQNPTTATMSRSRRVAIIAVARRYDLPIIEDAAYDLYPREPLPALVALAPERVYYMATTAKSISPGLRLAYVVVPEGQQSAIVAAIRATSMMASPLLVNLLTGWVRDGTAHAVLGGIRVEAVARQALCAAILPHELVAAHPEGLHVWLGLPSAWSRENFVSFVRAQGLALVPADAFVAEQGNPIPNAVRMALGVAGDHGRLEAALRALAKTLKTQPSVGFANIV
ncbi:MAG: PLP-dependent aminotransferase family protein [Acidocella sp.]|nr:PLP-dependent aminotransferase family protein [Acidocella sp.]